jgi:2-polyprenyl-3-methyl-5-hydroxy-6-metoxy-1,4-benzoquinol methylase
MKKKIFLELISWIKGKCLDIWCWNWWVGKKIMKCNHDISCYGIDRNSKLNKERYKYVREWDLIDMDKIIINKKEEFDLIIWFHIMEHIPLQNMKKILDNIFSLLKKWGVVFIETPHPVTKYIPKFLGFNFWTDPTHVKPYTPNQLEKLFHQKWFKTLYKSFDQAHFVELWESTHTLNFLKKFLYKLWVMRWVSVYAGQKK